MIARVLVGYTTHWPIRPDERSATYLIEVPLIGYDFDRAETDAKILACQWCESRPGVVMATSATVTDLLDV